MSEVFEFAAFLQSSTVNEKTGSDLSLVKVFKERTSLFDDYVDAINTAKASVESLTELSDTSWLSEWNESTEVEFSLPVPQVVTIVPEPRRPKVKKTYSSEMYAHHSILMEHSVAQYLDGVIQQVHETTPSSPLQPINLEVDQVETSSRKHMLLSIQERRLSSNKKSKDGSSSSASDIPSYTGPPFEDGKATTRGRKELKQRATHPPVVNTASSPLGAGLRRRAHTDTTMQQAKAHGALDDSFTINPLSRAPYTFTHFDLIGALLKILQRPDPTIRLGPVDLSCAFTVVDAQNPDHPVIFCSDTFCALTGYDRDDILGHNCRFLQAPGGGVKKGSERLFTDHMAVRYMKRHCVRLLECQISILNYKRDGTSFLNLVSIVPIKWGNSTEPVFLVGFQVDCGAHLGAIMGRMPNGECVVDYRDSILNSEQPSLGVSGTGQLLDKLDKGKARAFSES